jgi:hypothetical protein
VRDGLECIGQYGIATNVQICVVLLDGASVTGVCRGKWQAA